MVPGGWVKIDGMTPDSLNWMFSGARIISFKGTAVTAEGADIGFPPLHMHHLHVSRVPHGGYDLEDYILTKLSNASHEWISPEWNFHFFETHGDFGVGDSFGVGASSSEGYRRSLPEGYCLHTPIGNDVAVYAMLNDVRVRGAAYDAWLQLEVTLADGDCRRAGQLWFHSPKRSVMRHNAQGTRGRFDQMDPFQFDALSEPSVAWWTAHMPVSGRMLPGLWIHMHRVRAAHFLMHRGLPHHAICAAVTTPNNHHSTVPLRPDHNRSGVLALHEAALEQLYARLAADDATICHDDPNMPTSVFIRSHPELRPRSSYDRQGALECAPWVFAAGDVATVVVFARVNWDPELALVGMHVTPFFYIELDDANAPEHDWAVYSEPLNPECAPPPHRRSRASCGSVRLVCCSLRRSACSVRSRCDAEAADKV